MAGLVRLFLLEELRLRSSFSSAFSLLLFPQMVFLGALAGYVFVPVIAYSITYENLHTAIMTGLFLFGISMGGLAFLGKDFIERALGPVTMLAASVMYQPVSHRRMYISYFIHDLIFYILLVLIPLSAGLGLGTVARGMDPWRYLLICTHQWSAFLMGISLSLLVSSAMAHRRRPMLLMIGVGFIPLISLQVFTGRLDAFVIPLLGILENSWAYLPLSLGVSLFYIALGVFIFDGGTMNVTTGAVGSYVSIYRRLNNVMTPLKRGLFSREVINLIRGRGYIRIIFSLVIPMAVILAMAGIIGGIEGAPIQFNMVFFSVMVSFFTVSIYSNLVNMDYLDFDQTLPITTPAMIRMKLLGHVLISTPISLVVVLVIAALLGEWSGILIGLPVMLVSIPYMGFVTAYLTGLWTNSMLFDSTVFMKYLLFTVLPLMSATVLSYLMESMFWVSLVGLAVVVSVELGAIMLLSRGIENKWSDANLSSGSFRR